MAQKISLFNHKGGVSKTTTTFNLGWMIASKGKRVILVDCDPQCNLTGMVLGFDGISELSKFYNPEIPHNIKSGLAPAFESRPSPIIAAVCEEIGDQEGLYLLPGHIGLSEYEVTLGIAQELSGSLPTLRNLPGSISYLLDATAQKYEADIILIDMSPSVGPVNQNLLMISDYFIVPMLPDYFSSMAIDSLSNILPKWKAWAKSAASLEILKSADYPFPEKSPKFLGTVVQNYRSRSGVPAKAFQKWFDEIKEGLQNKLIPSLEQANMMLASEVYTSNGFKPEDPMLQMSDFNGLIARSQECQVPIFALTDEQLGQSGVVLENTKESMEKFRNLFSEAADRVISMIK